MRANDGVAKATAATPTNHILHTDFGSLVGIPQYKVAGVRHGGLGQERFLQSRRNRVKYLELMDFTTRCRCSIGVWDQEVVGSNPATPTPGTSGARCGEVNKMEVPDLDRTTPD